MLSINRIHHTERKCRWIDSIWCCSNLAMQYSVRYFCSSPLLQFHVLIPTIFIYWAYFSTLIIAPEDVFHISLINPKAIGFCLGHFLINHLFVIYLIFELQRITKHSVKLMKQLSIQYCPIKDGTLETILFDYVRR